VVLLDVTPLSLGIETLGNVMTRIIERNTTIPTKKSQVFSTAADSQTEVTIRVLQGEREMADDNRTLGRFDLVGIPPAPRGMPQIDVTFDIDANGIVHVSAKDRATGKEQKIVVQASSGLSDDEIDGMVKSAEEHSEEDKKKRTLVEARNSADNLIYTIEKSLKEHGDKVSEADRKPVEDAIADLRGAIGEDDAEAIKARTETLSGSYSKIAEALYKEASGQASEQATGQTSGQSSGQASEPASEQGSGQTPGQTSGEGAKPDGDEKAGGEAGEAVDADYQVVDDDTENKGKS
jgi:molecular chaperone DnaK